MADVDFDKTLAAKKLVLKNDDVFSIGHFYFVIIFIAAMVICLYREEEDVLYRRLYLYLFMPVVLGAAIYLLYKKFTELNLKTVVSPLSIPGNRKIVENYLTKQDWDFEYKGENYLQATSTTGIPREIQATIIFIEGAILINVVYSRRWWDELPILFTTGNMKRCIERDIEISINPDADKEIP